MDKLTPIIVDPIPESRMRLKQATVALVDFSAAQMLNDIRSALERLRTSPPKSIDIIFLSYRLPKNEIMEFIHTAKKTPSSEDAAFVMLLKDEDRSGGSVATNLLMGGDGFLFEPYSVDKLRETSLLAAKVKKERSQAREIGALSMLVTDLADSINALAMVEAGSTAASPLLRQLKEKCSTINQLSDELKKAYFDLTVDTFEALPAPKKRDRPYKGASSRTKARMAKKAADSIEEKLTKG